MASHLIAAFYRFVSLPEYASLREPIRAFAESRGIQGTILLAEEGINGTISGGDRAIGAFFTYLQAMPGLDPIDVKFSCSDEPPFYRLKVRLKREIVTIGDGSVDPTQVVGTYIEPKAWNELIARKIPLVDTRNDYEVRVGTFEGAIDPGIRSFRDFPSWMRENLDPHETPEVAMFCTGGIRCEKASSLLLREGFSRVYHLKGGILRYLEEVPQAASKWNGECFVFDRRVSVDHDLRPGTHAVCFGCKEPVSSEERRSPRFEEGICCPRCHTSTTEVDRARRRQRVRQIELAQVRGNVHLGYEAELDPERVYP